VMNHIRLRVRHREAASTRGRPAGRPSNTKCAAAQSNAPPTWPAPSRSQRFCRSTSTSQPFTHSSESATRCATCPNPARSAPWWSNCDPRRLAAGSAYQKPGAAQTFSRQSSTGYLLLYGPRKERKALKKRRKAEEAQKKQRNSWSCWASWYKPRPGNGSPTRRRAARTLTGWAPGKVLVGHQACLGHGGGHTTWTCRTCDQTMYGPPLSLYCTYLDGPARVRISSG